MDKAIICWEPKSKDTIRVWLLRSKYIHTVTTKKRQPSATPSGGGKIRPSLRIREIKCQR